MSGAVQPGETPLVERIRMAQRRSPDPLEYAKRQTAAKVTRDTWQSYRSDLDRQYQNYAYAPSAKRRKLEQLARAERRAWDRFWDYLGAISPRCWDAGVPVHWIVDTLGYQDAITYGPLSVEPPCAFGWDRRDREFQRIIGALKAEGEVQP